MKKDRRGFTLIELLAVIIILGLLIAIAIPSVTKYITQSRKKTLANTIGNYIAALTNEVNDMEYTFTASNTVYAVPIECIALERGGTNPFGEWMLVNDNYWAYVLVQYDDSISSYTYGFTFKDSAGYELYPTTIEKLEESGSQIKTGDSLKKPVSGTAVNIVAKGNWIGFDVNDNTQLFVLEAKAEGNGIDSCTLHQKGDNYEDIEKVETNKLPDDYEKLNYIEGTGTQYINTNYKVKTRNVILEIKMNIEKLNDRDLVIIGNLYPDAKGSSIMLGKGYSNYPYAFSKANSVSDGSTFSKIKIQENQTYIIKGVYDGVSNTKSFYINNEFQSSNQYTSLLNQMTYPISILKSGDFDPLAAKIYYVKVYDDNVLVLDLVPCYRKEDGKVGMFNMINKEFFISAGTGQFIGG